jgi:beta-glucanase (GH16 family)
VSGLIFADEFNDSTIDREVWSPTWLKGDTGYSPPINGQESGCYHSGQASESDGALHLVTAATTSTLCRTRSGAAASIQSGIVTSAGKLEFQNGYFEARIDMDAVNWPAWWTNGHHTDWPDRGELDIMELLSCREPAWHVHYTGTEAGSCEDRSVAGWHTYGMRWTPNRVDFFYDGVLVGGANVNIPYDHYLVLNHAVRNTYTNGMVVGADMKVDYVRVWDLD